MANLQNKLLKISLLFFILSLSGCQSLDVRGNFISEDDISRINNTKPAQEELVNMIGNPTYTPDYSPDIWYYIHRTIARRAWLNPKVKQQKIVKITFDKDKKVSAVELLEDTHDEAIKIQSSYTETYGTEQNAIQKFVKNIGKFNKLSTGKKTKRKK